MVSMRKAHSRHKIHQLLHATGLILWHGSVNWYKLLPSIKTSEQLNAGCQKFLFKCSACQCSLAWWYNKCFDAPVSELDPLSFIFSDRDEARWSYWPERVLKNITFSYQTFCCEILEYRKPFSLKSYPRISKHPLLIF